MKDLHLNSTFYGWRDEHHFENVRQVSSFTLLKRALTHKVCITTIEQLSSCLAVCEQPQSKSLHEIFIKCSESSKEEVIKCLVTSIKHCWHGNHFWSSSRENFQFTLSPLLLT